jgi:chromosome segregation ATPase
MADRIAALHAEIESIHASVPRQQPTPVTSSRQKSSKAPIEPPVEEDAVIAQLRLDLAEALRSKGVAETRLRTAEEELDKLRAKTRSDSKSLRNLESEKGSLTRKLKDRDHELREKRKLLEEVQDEMITLGLQMTVAEKERDAVKKENKELVDRWMRRMTKEVDAMNLANEPAIDKGKR